MTTPRFHIQPGDVPAGNLADSLTEQAFRGLCIEIMRSTVNGFDRKDRIKFWLTRLVVELPEATRSDEIINAILAEYSEKLQPDRASPRIDFKFKAVRDAIRFAAETFAIDEAAPGRAGVYR